jgi:hypothetical protein
MRGTASVVAIAALAAACAKAAPPSTSSSARRGGPDLASSKHAYVADCSKDTRGAEDFCACAFDVAREIYGDDALIGPDRPSEDDMAKIHVKVARACVAHVPPEAIRASFVNDCLRGEKDREAYCSCAWNELLGRMTPNEVAVERAKHTERFGAAMSGASHACQRFR